jgi:ADP-dependent NAD(P)H-hydrate dehydratase
MVEPAKKPALVTDLPRLPERPPDVHKGRAGRVALIAGSRGLSGAACLAGLGALRGGAGLVRVYSPVSVQPIVAASEPGLMAIPLPEDEEGRFAPAGALAKLQQDLGWIDVVALGPGLGQSPELPAFVVALLDLFDKPAVIDADGLNNLARTDPRQPWWTVRAGRPTIVTPHPGEMARLRGSAGLPPRDGQDDETRLAVTGDFARLTGAVTVLKGFRTVVASPEAAYVNTTGNPGMATGGMGDVLTGLIAALLGQGLSAFDAARLGVHVHGLAADRLAKQIAPVGYLARELADALPGALAETSRAPIGFR